MLVIAEAHKSEVPRLRSFIAEQEVTRSNSTHILMHGVPEQEWVAESGCLFKVETANGVLAGTAIVVALVMRAIDQQNRSCTNLGKMTLKAESLPCAIENDHCRPPPLSPTAGDASGRVQPTFVEGYADVTAS